MPRPLDAVDIIDLPTLTANEAHTLAQSLENAARDEKGRPRKLPEAAREALDEMIARRLALLEVLHDGPSDEGKVKPVDLRIDRLLSAMYRIAGAWSKLEEELPEGAAGAEIVGRLFPDGLGFTNLAPRAEWSEIEARLDVIRRDSLDARLEAIGLGPVIKALREVQVEYGKVTGATAAPAVPESPQIRSRKLELQDVMREYVAAVIGSVRKSKPETRELADILLRPLAEWRSRSTRRAQPKPDAGGPTDDTGAPPTTQPQ